MQRLLFILFELPADKLGFRLVTVEVIINLTFLLDEQAKIGKDMDSLVQDTQRFFKYAIEGLGHKRTRRISSQCFLKLCQKTAKYMHPFTVDIIQSTTPGDGSSAPKLEDWDFDTTSKNVLAGLANLICRVASHDSEKCAQYLKGILQLLFVPLKSKMDWIRKEQSKLASKKIAERELNEFVYRRAQDLLSLIAHFLEHCQSLEQEPIDPRIPD